MNTFIESLLTENFDSEYSHRNYVELVGGKRHFYMDCSGFVYWCLFQMGYKRALVEIRRFLKDNSFIKINRMFCKDFAFIHEHANDFRYLQFVDEPCENSILVVVFADGNGHCMIVDKVVCQENNEYLLRVVDSTRYPHQNDSRQKTETGIGMGEISIYKKNGEYIYDSKNANVEPRKADVYFVLPKK